LVNYYLLVSLFGVGGSMAKMLQVFRCLISMLAEYEKRS